MTLPLALSKNRKDENGLPLAWDTKAVHDLLNKESPGQSLRTTERTLELSALIPGVLKTEQVRDEFGAAPIATVLMNLEEQAKRKRFLSMVIQEHQSGQAGTVLFANDGRKARHWLFVGALEDSESLLAALKVLAAGRNLIAWPHGQLTGKFRKLAQAFGSHDIPLGADNILRVGTVAYRSACQPISAIKEPHQKAATDELSHLDRLEADSIHIIREVMAQAENPVMLYSIGKDSSVMLHLAQKAFYPSALPFPLMHVDTRWKFQEMYQFRDQMAATFDLDIVTHINPQGIANNINPFDHGSSVHTDVMKTQGLKQALDLHGFDVAFGGARRDEEKSRAKERVFSFRTKTHRWDPKNQRPELWNLYNGFKTKGESIRVFPLSNWTELDIWEYINREKIPIVPLYFAAERPVVERDGLLLLVDDDRFELAENEKIQIKKVRFRTLGCYPLSGAIESEAADIPSIILELLTCNNSEREGRAIDSDSSSSMEKKKQEGYF